MNSKGSEDLAKTREFSRNRTRRVRVLFSKMSWRIIFIEESEYLSLYLDNIKIRNNDDEILIPISDINTLILDNYKTTLSVHLINALTKSNVNVVLCGIEHLPQSIIFPTSGHHMSSVMIRKQLQWTQDIRNKIHQIIVRHKIYNQKQLLKHLHLDNQVIDKIQQFENEIKLGDVTNREGLVAKMYFRTLFGKSFKRFQEDVVNAGLNYGYAVLRSQISRVLVAKGLNTSIGFFHKGPTNDFNLSDDIIEPFRPIIDYWVSTNLIETAVFMREHRIEIIKQTTKDVYFLRKKQSLFNTIILYIEAVLNFVETGETEKLEHPEIKYNEL